MKQYPPSFPAQPSFPPMPAPAYRPTAPFSAPQQYYGGSNGFSSSIQQVAPPSFQTPASYSFGAVPQMNSPMFGQQQPMSSFYSSSSLQSSQFPYGPVPPMTLSPPPLQKPMYAANNPSLSMSYSSAPLPAASQPMQPSLPSQQLMQQQYNGMQALTGGSTLGSQQTSSSTFNSSPPRQQATLSYGTSSTGPLNEVASEIQTIPTYGVPPQQQQQQQQVSLPSSSSSEYAMESNSQSTAPLPSRPQSPNDFLPIYSAASLSGASQNSVTGSMTNSNPGSTMNSNPSYENNFY